MRNSTAASAEDINVAIFRGDSWLPEIASYEHDHAPDPLLMYEVMRKSEAYVDVIDPYPLPANPFGRSNQLYCGLDFVRAADVMFRRKKYDLILSVFESSALFPLLLRKLSPSPPILAIWDIGLIGMAGAQVRPEHRSAAR